jgi:hypothetical protein
MEKQLTAVEWLIDKFSTQGTLHSSDMSQAKEMEKKQDRAAYKRGQRHKKPLKDSNPIKW